MNPSATTPDLLELYDLEESFQFFPSSSQPVPETQNLHEVSEQWPGGVMDQFVSGEDSSYPNASTGMQEIKFGNFDDSSDEDMISESPQRVIPQVGIPSFMSVSLDSGSVTLEQLVAEGLGAVGGHSNEELPGIVYETVLTGQGQVSDFSTALPAAVTSPDSSWPSSSGTLPPPQPEPTVSVPNIFMIPTHNEIPVSSRQGRRTPKKPKKYMQDPNSDPSGKVLHAIIAKKNRDKKKKQFEDLVSRTKVAEQAMKSQEKVIRDLSSKLRLAKQENSLLTLRAEEAEAKLAEQIRVMSKFQSPPQ